jgi:multidrug efflux pump subunit AcrA (membrane-fusion protein)
MTQRRGAPWLNYLLGALCVGAILAAILVVGPAAESQKAVTRTAKAVRGVVQSTVSGSGNLQAASQLNLGFKTSGTVTKINVTQGQHVTQGQLLATLDPQSAEVTLEQAKAALQSAEANLAREQETDGESSGNSGAGNGASAATASVHRASMTALPATGDQPAGPPSASTTPAATTPSTPTATTPTPSTSDTAPTATTTPAATKKSETPVNRSTSRKTKAPRKTEDEEASATPSTSKLSTATREANIASARAAVRSDQLTVQSDEEAVQNTKLYAPEDGTIVTLSGQVGEVVSASGTTRASSDSSSSDSSGSGASATGISATGRSATNSSATSSSSDSSSSSFAVLSDLSSMQLVVALSESEIGNVRVGQIATVTVEALNGAKLAAHVHEVATLSTSSSGVVSYNVTFQLDQMTAGLKPGMSATAEVVIKQAEGVSAPSSAISGGSVTVLQSGKQVRRSVVTGLAGNSSTIILSGLKAGETVVLPAATSTSSSTSLTSRLSRLAGAGGGLGGGGGLAGAGGGGFTRGGGAALFRGGG